MAKDPAAVSLGRRGGQVTGVPKGFSSLSDEDRRKMGQKAAKARWAKVRQAKREKGRP